MLDQDVVKVIISGTARVLEDAEYHRGRNVTSWVNEPPTRGTFRLLVGCIATLSLCVYSALHLNLLPPPKRERSPGQKGGESPSRPSLSTVLSRKATWVLIGVLAPEFVVYTAWSQWRTARKLTSLVASSPEAKDLEWSMSHSFFALMGGFAVDTDDPGEDEYIVSSPRLHLTANGVAALAEIGLLPSVSKDFILDKSKADHFTKALVLLQAGWLIIDCVARTVDCLPISLLEVNTLAHIACAVVTYGLWWHKPLDVHQPVLLTGEWKRPLMAAMAMCSRPGRNLTPEMDAILHYRSQSPTNSPVDLSGPLKILPRRARGRASPRPRILNVPAANDSSFTLPDGTQFSKKITLREGDVLLPFGFGPKPSSTFFRWEGLSNSKPPIRFDLDTKTLTRWSLACQSFSDHPTLWSRFRSVTRVSQRSGTSYIVQEYPESKLNVDFVCKTVPNWPDRDLLPHHQKYTPMAFFSACVIFYGGIHAAAWSDYFPSDNERLFWRIAAVYVAGSGFSWFALRALQIRLKGIYDTRVRGRAGSWLTTPLGAVLMMLPMYILTAVGFGYLVARVYLVVEAFISLRDVPVELYLTPKWSRYLVHF